MVINMQQPVRTHKSLEKGLLLLNAFLPDNKELGTVELSRLAGMHRSTVSRLLSVLKRHGFVRQNDENKKYSIGPTVAHLSTAYRRSFQSTFSQLAKPYLDQLRNEAAQTVVLEIPSGGYTVLTYVAEGFGSIRIAGRVGDRHHYHTSAGAQCILAFSSNERIDEILNADLPQLTPNSLVNPEALKKELEAIRKRGFAFDGEGNNLGINAFGVPVFDSDGSPAGAIVIAGASHMVTWDKRQHFVELLQRASENIGSSLTSGGMANA